MPQPMTAVCEPTPQIIHYLRIAARRFATQHLPYPEDEAFSAALMALRRCLRTWQPERGAKFTTLLTWAARRAMVKDYKRWWRNWGQFKWVPLSRRVGDEEDFDVPDLRPTPSDTRGFRRLVWRVDDPRKRRLLLLLYSDRTTQTAAAQRLGVSCVTARKWHREAIGELRQSLTAEEARHAQ